MVTEHKVQRKSPVKNNLQKSIKTEAVYIEEAQSGIIKELLDVIQHVREETADMSITPALRRRLDRASSLVKDSSLCQHRLADLDIQRQTISTNPSSISSRRSTNAEQDSDDNVQHLHRNSLNPRQTSTTDEAQTDCVLVPVFHNVKF